MTTPRTPREKVLLAFELRDRGLNNNKIERAVGTGNGTVARWFADPALNPYLDPVAIERAVEGDLKVYDALTVYERELVCDRLNEEWERSEAKFTGNQHAPADPASHLWARFGDAADRVRGNCARRRDALATRARRATA